MRPSDLLTVRIEGLSLEGDGLVTIEGRTLSVPRAFVGEQVEVRVEHVSRQKPTAVGRLLRVLEPHAGRRTSPCPDDVTNGGRCTGCPLGTLDVEAQRASKRAMLSERYGLDVADVVGGEALGYRASSKRVAFSHYPRLALGSYVRGTHRAADMRHCRVDHPRIAEAARAIADRATELGITPFDERDGEGMLRSVWLKTDGTRVLATLVVARDDRRFVELARSVREVDAFALALAREGSNDLRGVDARPLAGKCDLTSEIAGEPQSVGPLGFLQPNPTVAARAYVDLVSGEAGSPLTGTLALDLYAGAGVTTRLLRRSFGEVIPCESHPESARALGIEPSTAESFLAEFLARAPRRRPELVVANPPRGGLGDAVCDALRALAPDHLAIMSCHPGTLARDLARLEHEGLYRRSSLAAYDTLPQTPHVELVVRLERTMPQSETP